MTTTLPSKEMAELQRRFKPGYTVKQNARGGHFRVLDPAGEPVRREDGQPLMLPGTPHGGRQTKNVEAELRKAGVLRSRRGENLAELSPESRQRGALKTNEIRQQARQEQANHLYAKLEPILDRIGGWSQPGNMADVGHVAAEIARGRGEMQMTPDLLSLNATRVRDKHWVEPRYQEIWFALAEKIEASADPIEAYFGLLRKARNLPEKEEFVVSQLKLMDGEWPFEVRKVKLDLCFVDHSYQRPPVWPFVRKLAVTFDETLVGAIDVSERAGGKLAIMDGQLRYEAMRLVGKKTVWAAVYYALDQRAEARFFLHKNQDRKAIHTYWVFRAKTIAGDEESIAVEKIAKKHGYRIWMTSAASGDDARNISAISACEDAYKRSSDTRKECLSPTLAVMKASTFGRKQGAGSTLIRGLGRLFQLNDELDSERLAGAISERGPEWLAGRAREEARGSGSAQMPAMTRILAGEYNRTLGRGERNLRLRDG